MAFSDMNPWKQDFPALRQEMNGKALVYLDSAASAQKPEVVLDVLRRGYELKYANIHRGLYTFSQVKTEEYEAARSKISRFIGADNPNTIVFTRNATEAINLVAQSYGRTFLTAGDEVIVSEMEHHANIVPWQLLRDQIGIVIKVIPIFDDGVLDMEAFSRLLSPRTRIVAVTQISNVLGTINNISEIIELSKNFNPKIKVLIDGSQGVVHRPIDMSEFAPEMGPDFYVFTGHKLYGPTGIGVLYGKYDVLDSMPPYQGGGDMVDRVTFAKTTYQSPPARFEAGTPAFVEAIALGAATDYLIEADMGGIELYEQVMLAHAVDALCEIPGLTLYGQAADRAGILSFTLDGLDSGDIAMILDQMGIAVRAGHHCCMPLMDRLGVSGTVRASIALYTEASDIDKLVEGLKKAKELLG
jgi:cysteine desulfurase/selenocysteine lyase